MRPRLLSLLLSSLAIASPAAPASAQELYDDSQLRTLELSFVESNWWTLLESNWTAGNGVLLSGDLTYDGMTYPGVGVRIKGGVSFEHLPPQSQKASFTIDVDHTTSTLDIEGYQTLNLNNGFEDPTFCREVSFFNFIREFTPAPRGNHVELRINGENWGVYANIQQYNKDLLREYFVDEDGPRWKCTDTQSGALSYLGASASAYLARYELKDDGGLANPWQVLIDTCFSITSGSLVNLEDIDKDFSIDAACWALAAENLFMDEDSYIKEGADFYVYHDPQHQRSHLHQYDGNESFGVSLAGWPGGSLYTVSPLFNFDDPTKPVLKRLMSVTEVRERYFAHLRTMLESFSWTEMGPTLLGYKNLLDAAVQADSKKIYTHAEFVTGFTSDLVVPYYATPGSLTVPGLQNFVQSRRTYLLAHPDLSKPTPEIVSVDYTPAHPDGSSSVFITAKVQGPVAAVGEVRFHYRESGPYLPVAMHDDGQHADGAPGDGVFGGALPVASNGAFVEFYVSAASEASAGGALQFSPRKAEGQPLSIRFGYGSDGLRVTEYMYAGMGAEFIELSNLSASPIDTTGWSLDDSSGVAGSFDLSSAGLVQPGEAIVVTDSSAAAFIADWSLAGVTILGNLQDNLSRNDAIHLFDAQGVLVDRLQFGDQDFPGSVRARYSSASVCMNGVGRDDPYSWFLAFPGDAQQSATSTNGDVGSPGSWSPSGPCTIGANFCAASINSTGGGASIFATGSASLTANNLVLHADSVPAVQPGIFYLGPNKVQLPFGDGFRCVGGQVTRLRPAIVSSSAGNYELAVDYTELPASAGLAVAVTRHFQCWFRDPAAQGTGFNLSDGLSLTFTP